MASAAAAAASSTARMIRVDALMYLRPSHVSLIAVKASSLLSMWLFAFVCASPAGPPRRMAGPERGAGTVALAMGLEHHTFVGQVQSGSVSDRVERLDLRFGDSLRRLGPCCSSVPLRPPSHDLPRWTVSARKIHGGSGHSSASALAGGRLRARAARRVVPSS